MIVAHSFGIISYSNSVSLIVKSLVVQIHSADQPKYMISMAEMRSFASVYELEETSEHRRLTRRKWG